MNESFCLFPYCVVTDEFFGTNEGGFRKQEFGRLYLGGVRQYRPMTMNLRNGYRIGTRRSICWICISLMSILRFRFYTRRLFLRHIIMGEHHDRFPCFYYPVPIFLFVASQVQSRRIPFLQNLRSTPQPSLDPHLIADVTVSRLSSYLPCSPSQHATSKTILQAPLRRLTAP